jgi:hypothetical protein
MQNVSDAHPRHPERSIGIAMGCGVVADMSVPRDRALLAICAAHRRALTSYANGIIGDRGHAEDIMQEAWLRERLMSALSSHPEHWILRTSRISG